MLTVDGRRFDHTELAAYQRPEEYREKVRYFKHTLEGFAKRVYTYLDGGVMYDHNSGAAWLWNGQYWVSAGHQNTKVAMVANLVKEQLEVEAKEEEDENRKKALTKWIRSIENSSVFYESVIKKLRAYTAVSLEDMPNNALYVNAPNGVINLKTGKTVPHDKKYMMMGMTGIPLKYEASLKRKSIPKVWEHLVEKAPKIAGFLYQTFSVKSNTEKENLERMHYVLCVLANLLNGSSDIHKFYVMKGKGGNGKGTLDKLMSGIMGPYARTADPEMFTSKQMDVKRLTADFIGIRFIAIPEVGKKARINAALVKNWSGGDEISYMRLYQAEGKFVPESTLVFSLNHNLHLDEYGPAMRRRFVLLRAENSAKDLPSGEVRGYHKTLLEEDGEVFGSVLLRLSLSLLNGEIVEPECIARDSRQYIDNDDIITRFISECFTVSSPEYDWEEGDVPYMTVGELYYHYKTYNGRYGSGYRAAMNMQAFQQALEDVQMLPAIHWGYYTGDEFKPDPDRGMRDFVPRIKMTDEGRRLMYGRTASDVAQREFSGFKEYEAPPADVGYRD